MEHTFVATIGDVGLLPWSPSSESAIIEA